MQFDQFKRREFITLLGGATVVWPLAARAQLTERVRRIGVLMSFAEDDSDTKARLTGFRHELERLGWSEGHNVRIDIASRLPVFRRLCSRRNCSPCNPT